MQLGTMPDDLRGMHADIDRVSASIVGHEFSDGAALETQYVYNGINHWAKETRVSAF